MNALILVREASVNRERAKELAEACAVIHANQGNKISAAMVEELLLQFASEVLTEQAAEINTWIHPGDLGGDGLDKHAQRNGLILAHNATVARAAALRSPEGE